MFDAKDRLISSTDRNGVNVEMTYDQMDRVRFQTPTGGSSEETQYNVYGVWKQIRPGGATTVYGYDAAGRRTSEPTSNSENLAYAFSPDRNLCCYRQSVLLSSSSL